MKKLLLSTALLAVIAGDASAQSQTNDTGGGKDSVQYALILPEEKTPELVKPEENNPFESAADGAQKDVGTSEENQVRDILLRLPAVGGASGPSGMRILLGGMRLVAGGMVPPVLPDQQVALKVKSITPSGIELVWVEKKPTGLPPKTLIIPMDGAAKVRYRLPNNGGTDTNHGATSMGKIRRNGAPVLVPQEETPQPPVQTVAARLEVEVKKALPVTSTPPSPPPSSLTAAAPSTAPAEAAPSSLPPPSPPPAAASATVPEASVLRMLFGNHAPAGK